MKLHAAIALLTLAGCSDSFTADARFSGAEHFLIHRAYVAGSGQDVLHGAMLGTLFSGDHDPAACPARTTDGQVTIVTGDCVDRDGKQWSGRIVITNVDRLFGDNPAFDPSKPGTVEIDSLVVVDGNTTEAIHGVVEIRDDGDVFHIAGEIRNAVTDDRFVAFGASSDINLQVMRDGTTVIESGSTIEVDSLGGAMTEGTYRYNLPLGSLTLTGEDAITFDIAAMTESECFPYAIDGSRGGMICD